MSVHSQRPGSFRAKYIYNPSYSNLYHTPESESPFSLQEPDNGRLRARPHPHRKVNMGTVFSPKLTVNVTATLVTVLLFFFVSFCHYFFLKKKKSKGQRTLAGEDLDRHIRVSLILIHTC